MLEPINTHEIHPSMNDLVKREKTGILWRRFCQLTHIPRASGKEHQAVEWLINIAKEHGLECIIDNEDGKRAGNVIIKVPGKGSGVTAPSVAVQCHSDMVCINSNGEPFEGGVQPKRTMQDGRDLLTCSETTLGADNGIGLSMALALIEDTTLRNHPPIEIICTDYEEDGMLGARNLNPSHIESLMLINLDAESENQIWVKCASGTTATVTFHLREELIPEGYAVVECSLKNFPGGHSGLNIHEQRGNPIVMLCECVSNIFSRESTALLISISGGAKKNAIPEQCSVTFAVPDDTAQRLVNELKKESFDAAVGEDYLKRPIFAANILKNNISQTAHSNITSKSVLFAISTVPYGSLEADYHELVVLSNNPAIITTERNSVTLTNFVRGVVAKEIQGVLDEIKSSARTANIKCSIEHQQPEDGWDASRDNPLIEIATEAFKSVFKKDPTVGGVHAGLETRIIESRMSECFKCISIGPTMGGVHAAGEWVDVESVDRTYKALCEMLELLSTVKR